ncbi:MAG: glycosyltransferase [Candidatus Bathyarchaeia archaeon]
MKNRKRIRIIFIHRRSLPSFVESDLRILKKHFVVYPVCVSFNILVTLRDLIRSLTNADLIFVWFAGFQAFIATFLKKFFGKKLVVVAGGYDAAYVPEINYGVFTCWWRTIMAIFAYRNADLVLAVSDYTKNELLQHVTPKKICVVHNGVDTKKFYPSEEKDDFVLTVGAVNWSNLKKKGLEDFVKVASLLPEVPFILVGKHVDDSIKYLKEIASTNVKFTGHVSFGELLEFYRLARVYAQLSYHESFGVALAEAMSCECVPVIAKRTALPEVAGDCGIYVSYGDVNATASAIKRAFEKRELGKCARKRIIQMFSMEKREENLIKYLSTLLEK